jgi:hypothetical protein
MEVRVETGKPLNSNHSFRLGLSTHGERLAVEAFAGGDLLDSAAAQFRELLHRSPERHRGADREVPPKPAWRAANSTFHTKG